MKEFINKWDEVLFTWLLIHGLKIIIIIAAAYILNKISIRVIAKSVKIVIKEKSHSKEAEIKRVQTLIRIFTWTISIIILIIAILTILPEFGISVAPILAGAGIIGLAVGFGGQYLIRDIISGFFIILENQYRIGDVVKFDETSGQVEDISLRMTTLRDQDGTVYHVPHGEIKKVANLTKFYARVNLNMGISYTSDLEKVIEVVNKVGNDLSVDPQWKPMIIKAPQFLRIDDFGDSAIIIKILGETQPIKQWDVTGELRKRLKIAFDKENIEIPYPQLVINMPGNNIPHPAEKTNQKL
jgi:small-conductance mechanosensitive channel